MTEITINAADLPRIRQRLAQMEGERKTMTDTKAAETAQPIAAGELKAFFERIEKLIAEKKELGEDLADVYREAKGRGFDTKIMRIVVRLRAMEPHARNELDELVDLYRKAVGI